MKSSTSCKGKLVKAASLPVAVLAALALTLAVTPVADVADMLGARADGGGAAATVEGTGTSDAATSSVRASTTEHGGTAANSSSADVTLDADWSLLDECGDLAEGYIASVFEAAAGEAAGQQGVAASTEMAGDGTSTSAAMAATACAGEEDAAVATSAADADAGTVAEGTAGSASSSSSMSPLANYGESHFTDEQLALYQAMKEFVKDVAANGGSTAFTYTFDETYSAGTTEVLDCYYALDVDAIFSAVLADCPYEFYWCDKTADNLVSLEVVTLADGTVGLTSITIVFVPADEYAGSDDYTVDETLAQATSAAAANAQAIVEEYAGETDEATVLEAYKDEICALASYNDEAAGDDTTAYGNPWQLVWVFDGDDSTKVVCEGYAKAFQYLCDLTWPDNDPVTCYTVTGTMSGGTGAGEHMWNLVALSGTEGSYLVDVTNSDEGTVGQSGGLFFASAVEADASSASGYTFTVGSTAVSYVYDTTALGLYGEDILTLSDTTLLDGDDSDSTVEATEGWELCGTCEWTIGDDGVLTVRPAGGADEGTLESFGSYSAVPWYESRESVTAAVFEDGVKAAAGCGYLMFGCANLSSVDAAGLDTSAAEDMSMMFCSCSALESLDLSGFDTSSVVGMSYLFYGCTSLQSLDLTGWDTSSVTSSGSMFSGCTALSTLSLGEGFTLASELVLPVDATYGTGAWLAGDGTVCSSVGDIPSGTAGTYVALFSAAPLGTVSAAPATCAGESITASVELDESLVAAAFVELAYQWYDAGTGTALEGEASATLAIDEALLGGEYYCVVSDAAGYYSSTLTSEGVVAEHTAGSAVVENEETATCGAAGSYDSVVYCTECSTEIDRETVVVAATGEHSYEATGVVEATCAEDGYTTYVCSVCGDTYADAIPATGEHSYVAVVTAPACAEPGYTTYTCSVCGTSYADDYTAATGHSYVGAVTTAATATTDGVMTYTCSICGDSYDEAIPATGEADDGAGTDAGEDDAADSGSAGSEATDDGDAGTGTADAEADTGGADGAGTTTAKSTQSITVKAKKASTVKYSKLKKKAQSVKASKLYKVTGAKGKLSYSKVTVKRNGKKASSKVAKKITVSKAGKVTLKKGLAKGTYKVKVKVKAAATSKYKAPAAKTVTVTIKVK